MALAQTPDTGDARRPGLTQSVTFAGHTVVLELHGEVDFSSMDALAEIIAVTVAAQDLDLVIDLHDLQFMDLATVRVLAGAHTLLARRSRTLALRAPSQLHRHLLAVAGAGHLVETRTASH